MTKFKKDLRRSTRGRGAEKIEASEADRQPPVPYRKPMSIHTIMRCVDAKLRFPSASDTQLSQMLEIERHTVGLALKTPFAQQRLDMAYDLKPLIKHQLRNQTLNAFEYLNQVTRRATKDIEDESKAPDSSLLSAATRSALETLKGIGILKEYAVAEDKQLDASEVAELLKMTEMLKSELSDKIEEADAEIISEGEGVAAEGVSETEGKGPEISLDNGDQAAYTDATTQAKPTDA